MGFKSEKKTVELVIAAGKVPVLQGEAGFGKTALSREVADELGALFLNVDCNLLKEGEIGGLPVPQKRVRIKSDNKGNESEEEYYVTDYAIHTKLRIAQEYLEKNPNGRVLLMLDELN